jgi:hypothetical protein
MKVYIRTITHSGQTHVMHEGIMTVTHSGIAPVVFIYFEHTDKNFIAFVLSNYQYFFT